MKNLSATLLASAVAFAFSANGAVVFDYSTTTANESPAVAWGWVVGNDFQVTSAVTVNAVGVFAGCFTTSDPTATLPVAIYQNTSGGPAGTWSIVNGTSELVPNSGATVEGSKWVSLPTTVTLSPGSYSIVAIVQQLGNSAVPGFTGIGFDNAGGDLNLSQFITVTTVDTPTTPLADTLSGMTVYTSDLVPVPACGAGTFSVGAVAVPEPTTLIAGGLLLLPLGASTLRGLRSRKA